MPAAEFEHMAKFFTAPAYEVGLSRNDPAYTAQLAAEPAFARWVARNTREHKVAGYRIVTLSLKATGVPPGDATADQLDAVADWADAYSFGELRASHEQNLILADVRETDLFALWEKARAAGFATPNIGLLSDIICCPGGDFCSLANAKSIPIAAAVQKRFDDLDYQHDIGELDLNMSGCMNACGHHHIGHIGILGVDKQGSEWYQVSIGGSQGEHASLGKVIGPSFAQDAMPDVIEKIISVYLAQRHADEHFIDTARRIGIDPFKEKVYGQAAH